MDDCLFCKIIKGEIPAFKIYEDDKYLAFLDIFPVKNGQTLVVTKDHYSSNLTKVPEDVLKELIIIVQKVAKNIEKKLENVERCQIVFEGFHTDHIHAKLFPAFLPNPSEDAIVHMGNRAEDGNLKNLADKLRF